MPGSADDAESWAPETRNATSGNESCHDAGPYAPGTAAEGCCESGGCGATLGGVRTGPGGPCYGEG